MEDESGKDVNVWNYLSSVFSRNCLFKKLFKKVSIQETVKKKKKETVTIQYYIYCVYVNIRLDFTNFLN